MLDTFQRYKVAYMKVKEKSLSGENLKLLDIGPNGIGFGLYNHFENVKQTNLDIQKFDKELIKKYPDVDFVTYDGSVFPFEDKSFDIVLCSDTLEHIPRNLREEFLKESFRVAKDLVIFTFPVSTSAFFEKVLYYGTFKKSTFLKEHIEHGLPSVGEFEDMIEKTNFSILVRRDNINRFLWIPFKMTSSILAKLWKKKSTNFVFDKFKRYIRKERKVVNRGIGYSKTFVLERKR
jgi:ubiquinone/menaquinone biosynthesis C-methylase UbiE